MCSFTESQARRHACVGVTSNSHKRYKKRYSGLGIGYERGYRGLVRQPLGLPKT